MTSTVCTAQTKTSEHAMPTQSRYQVVNPRIGVLYSIFASALFCLIFTLLIFEQLRIGTDTIKWTMLVVPLAIYLFIGLIARSTDTHDYLASGRRVPAVFNGLTLCITAFGATGIVALTGLFYLIGFDALSIAIGLCLGILLMAVLFVPYLRKHGAYTIAGYFAHRFQSRLIRPVIAICLTVPVGLIVLAEIRMGLRIADFYFDQPTAILVGGLVSIAVLTMVFGGMRANTWSAGTQATVTLIGILLPLFVVATILTNLPVPQITYAAIMKIVARSEAFFGIVPQARDLMDIGLPGLAPVNITKPYNQPFGAIGQISFVLLLLSVALGTASMPTALNRAGTSVTVFEARKSMVWAMVIIGTVVLMLPAIAVFARYFIFTTFANIPTANAPQWLERLADYGFVFYDTNDAQLSAVTLKSARDSILFTLPAAADLPKVLIYLTGTGIFAASLAALSSHLLTLANMTGEDIALGFFKHKFHIQYRVLTSRLALLVIGFAAAYVAMGISTDPLLLMLWALTICASTVFPALFVSIWWKRVTKWGVAFGMAVGLGIALFYIYATHFLGMPKLFGIHSTIAFTIALPASVATMIIVSLSTPAPADNVLNIVRDIRIPGGETFHDREERLARNEQRRKRGSS